MVMQIHHTRVLSAEVKLKITAAFFF